MSFHLRPVQVMDRSASPSTSSSTVSDRTPPPQQQSSSSRINPIPTGKHSSPPQQNALPSQPPSSAGRPRRPLSPSSIRDVDLSNRGNMPPRKYPAPPTGHELMALFPPPPPLNVRAGPTSGYFQREERAFFAQAGKEIVRVQFEVDLPQNREGNQHSPHAQDDVRRPSNGSISPTESHSIPGPSRPWSLSSPHDTQSPHHLSPTTRNLPPVSFPSNGGATALTRTSSSRTGPITPIPVQPRQSPPFTHSSAQPHAGMPPNPPHSQRHSFAAPGSLPSPPGGEHAHLSGPANSSLQMHLPPDAMDQDYRDDPDEGWRRPMPHNQRRRAGKHTKRVVVK